MPKALSSKSEKESEELNGFLRFYLVECKHLSTAEFEKGAADIVAKYGRSKALLGLRQAVNDTMEELSDASNELVGLLDQSLAERGLVSFSELRRRYSSQYKRLLKRGNVKNDSEFYLASGIVSDLSTEISDEERVQLQRMIEVYELGKV